MSVASKRTPIVRVQPLLRARAIRGHFDYRLRPDQLQVDVGSLVRVRFGGRRALAVVLELARDSEVAPERLAEPDAVLAASLPEDLVELAMWLAREYCSTAARALSLVLPPGASGGSTPREQLTAELTDAGRAALRGEQRLGDAQRAVLERLLREDRALAAQLGTARLRRLERRGLVSLHSRAAQRHRAGPRPLTFGSATAPPLTSEQRRALGHVIDGLSGSGPRQGQLLLHGVTGSGKTEVYLRAVETTLAAGRGAIVLVPEIALTPQLVGGIARRLGGEVAQTLPSLRPAALPGPSSLRDPVLLDTQTSGDLLIGHPSPWHGHRYTGDRRAGLASLVPLLLGGSGARGGDGRASGHIPSLTWGGPSS